MSYVGRHRAPTQLHTRRRRAFVTSLACVASSAALVAVPAWSQAVDTTPYVQLVSSHVRFVSVVGTPEVGRVTNTAFDTSVAAQQPYDSAREEDESGSSRVPITRDYPSVEFEDANFVHHAQFGYGSNTFQWSTRLSPAWQGMATSPVTESTYWWINNGKAYGSGHEQMASYTFHGSFAARPGDTVDMANELTFECGEALCNGTLYSSYYIYR